MTVIAHERRRGLKKVGDQASDTRVGYCMSECAASDLGGALREAFAISRGTRCTQYLFSLSLSPPSQEKVPVSVFEDAIEQIEHRMGLSGQPRAIVFHEKNGRRHARCVWSRIRPAELTAINLPHFKLKLKDMSRQLYIENGWKMPQGLVATEERNPLNYSREGWQQAKRIGRNPETIKKVFQDCWAISDSMRAFRQTLEARGYYLAQGDRRGFVALDHQGEVYAVARWAGVKTKLINERLGDPITLPCVEDVKAKLSEQIDKKLVAFAHEVRSELETARSGLQDNRRKLVEAQRSERVFLLEFQVARWAEEARRRMRYFRPLSSFVSLFRRL